MNAIKGLIILDGWGHTSTQQNNAIALAHTPYWDALLKQYPNTLIKTHGEVVGLPESQMGNSEVGHLTLGAGRTIHQSYTRINQAIAQGSFSDTPALVEAIQSVNKAQSTLHVIGLLSDGGVHSHESHIHAALEQAHAQGVQRIALHIISDGRDTAPRCIKDSISRLKPVIAQTDAMIASLSGRYFAMDRDHRWERTEKAYRLIAEARSSEFAQDIEQAIDDAYARNENDEFISPTQIGNACPIAQNDAVLFLNYRSDRARQLSEALLGESFQAFERSEKHLPISLTTLTEYNETYDFPVMFPPPSLTNGFGEWVSKAGLKQLRIAETEKYPHVTFFFNGGIEQPFANEERVLIPSPKVATYDLAPEMSLPGIVSALTEAVQAQTFDTFIANFANPDMVGHTGDQPATQQGVEACDAALETVISAVLAIDGEVIVCADHGNAEQMFNPETQQAHTAHTTNPVPLVYVGKQHHSLRNNGSLMDVIPTLLSLLELEKPDEMDGVSLFID